MTKANMPTTLAGQLSELCKQMGARGDLHGQQFHQAMAEILNVEPDSEPFFSILLTLRRALAATTKDISEDPALDDEVRAYALGALQPLSLWLSLPSLRSNWSDARSAFQNAHMPLRMIANVQSLQGRRSAVDSDRVLDIDARLEELLEELDSAPMDDELRNFLSAQIRLLRSVLHLAPSLPVDSLWDIAFKVMGDLARERGRFEKASAAEEGGAFSKLARLTRRILTACEDAKKLADGAEVLGSAADYLQLGVG